MTHPREAEHPSGGSEETAGGCQGNDSSGIGAPPPGEEGRQRERSCHHGRTRHRKERVLHTRISEQLAEDLRAAAEDLRLPVSNLVRNVLEEAFSAAEQMSEDVGELLEDVIDRAEWASERVRRRRERRRQRRARARSRFAGAEGEAPAPPAEHAPSSEEAVGEAPAPRAEPSPATGPVPLHEVFPQVVAWQPVVLNQAARCARSGRALRPGERAYLGLTAEGPSELFLSEEALSA